MKNRNRIILTLFVVVGIACAYLFGTGKFYELRQGDITFFDANNCDLHTKSCEIELKDGKKIILDVLNRPLQSMKSQIYEVKTFGFEDDNMLISIVGVKMNMGLFEAKLIKTEENIYKTKLALPSCVSGLMKWKVSVISQKERMGANFIVDIE